MRTHTHVQYCQQLDYKVVCKALVHMVLLQYFQPVSKQSLLETWRPTLCHCVSCCYLCCLWKHHELASWRCEVRFIIIPNCRMKNEIHRQVHLQVLAMARYVLLYGAGKASQWEHCMLAIVTWKPNRKVSQIYSQHAYTCTCILCGRHAWGWKSSMWSIYTFTSQPCLFCVCYCQNALSHKVSLQQPVSYMLLSVYGDCAFTSKWCPVYCEYACYS